MNADKVTICVGHALGESHEFIQSIRFIMDRLRMSELVTLLERQDPGSSQDADIFCAVIDEPSKELLDLVQRRIDCGKDSIVFYHRDNSSVAVPGSWKAIANDPAGSVKVRRYLFISDLHMAILNAAARHKAKRSGELPRPVFG